MSADLRLAIGLLAGVGLGTGLVLLVAALRGTAAAARTKRNVQWERRIAAGVAAGLLVLVTTRWLAVAAGVGVLVAAWSQLFGAGRSARRGIDRLEALATWTESLRDMVATGAALPEALPASAVAAGPAIRPQVDSLIDRLQNREPLTESLLRFADDLGDPGADLVVAALVLNLRAQGRQLRAVLTALARSSRSELEARRRIEADRRAVRRGVQVVVLVTVVMALGLLTLNPSYVAPYREPEGQVVLAGVVAIFSVGFAWLRRLAEFRPPGRFLELSAARARPEISGLSR
jgi:nucleotide-binding universal stress UspA family protein